MIRHIRTLVTYAFLLIVCGILVFPFTLHIWLGFLVYTGVNRADISSLRGEKVFLNQNTGKH